MVLINQEFHIALSSTRQEAPSFCTNAAPAALVLQRSRRSGVSQRELAAEDGAPGVPRIGRKSGARAAPSALRPPLPPSRWFRCWWGMILTPAAGQSVF
ncbi:hypothetical protein NDU88_004553 [Pleurodeles waltl]|uniref:Uncharacterized protein n=1 Tax=Pleurodeles waltl TaxID=8319 RepID=A0AAV7RLN8_PLEWA|nr:hypothetical protein NDU88_004553 [Pleurodeles waltl]